MSWIPPWVSSDIAGDKDEKPGALIPDGQEYSEYAEGKTKEPSMARVWSQLPKQQRARITNGFGMF